MSFKNILGQDSSIRLLAAEIIAGRVGHAYLFAGITGIGKRKVALEFAKALNCAAAAEPPCDACPACAKIIAGTHPDVRVIRPEKDKVMISIDQMRGMMNAITLKPYEGRRKVAIIDGAGSMTSEASNALLKTLEEPPADATIILIAEDLGAIYETIRSRSQIVRFSPLDPAMIESIVALEGMDDPVAAKLASRLAGGSAGSALERMSPKYLERRSRALERVSKQRFFDEEFKAEDRAGWKEYLDILLLWYRDALLMKIGADERLFFNIDRTDEVRRAAAGFETGRIIDAIREIVLTGTYIDQNANPKLAVSVLEEHLCWK